MVVVDLCRALVTLKFTDVAPAGTVTEAGKVKVHHSLLESAITAPPAGAAEVRVTVPVELAPKMIVAGLKVNAASAAGAFGGLTVRVAVLATPL